MGFNMYEQVPKIKAELKKQGYRQKIPVDIFHKTIMIMFGMKKNTAIKWIQLFKANDLISIEKDKVIFNE